MSALKQNFARAESCSVDEVVFVFTVLGPEAAVEAGCYGVHGLYLEGARWDAEAGVLEESLPKVLNIFMFYHKYFPRPAPGAVLAAAHGAAQAAAGGAGGGGDRAPGLQVPGVRHAGQQGRVQHVSRVTNAACPRVQGRYGETNTTGNSSNFIFYIYLPSSREPDHWTNRGVAATCQIDT